MTHVFLIRFLDWPTFKILAFIRIETPTAGVVEKRPKKNKKQKQLSIALLEQVFSFSFDEINLNYVIVEVWMTKHNKTCFYPQQQK